MRNKIRNIIQKEVKEQIPEIEGHHIDTFTDAIYKQLSEFMSDEAMSELLSELQKDFVSLIDDLIPIVKEYEEKIDEILDTHIGKFIP